MSIPSPLHKWQVTPTEAIAIQKRLAPLVRQGPLPGPVHLVAGLDVAFSKADRLCFAGVVLWNLREQKVLETRIAVEPLTFPYVPGLLSFREGPALLAALRKLRQEPDLLMCDGQGIAHPRRLGIASHLGVLTGLASIGCGKSRLVGTHQEPLREKGARSLLRDGDEIIGSVLRTRTGVRPLFVSIGHRIDLPAAEELVLACCTRYRLPEPIRLADQLVAAAKRDSTSNIAVPGN